MLGNATIQATMLSSTTPDQLVPQDHPIRGIRPIVETALAELSPIIIREMYARMGRPSIPPEHLHLLKGSVLMALYSIRSECYRRW